MDAIDNLIYSALNRCLYPTLRTSNEVEGHEDINSPVIFPNEYNTQIGVSSYHRDIRGNFVQLDDSRIIENTIRKHWFDITNQVSYTNQIGMVDPTGSDIPIFNPSAGGITPQAYIKFNVPPYHIIFSYLVENTRIAQIFEKMIGMYLHDEKLTKAEANAFRWIMNTENLFYKLSSPSDVRGTNSQLRPSSEATRRNAYYRMFGMDLAFGDINNNTYAYQKAEFSNSGFISLFENFLMEIWQGYINANNTSGANTTDTEHLEDLGRRLQEMLMSRRTTDLNFNSYRYFNLSAEEYSSYIFMYWLFYAISFDSPIVTFLKSEANTAGERLLNIGRRVGLNAHTKSVAILDIAQPMSTILRSVELGIFNDSNFINRIVRSLSTINPIPGDTTMERNMLNNLLLIINNWEKATGHRIKNPGTPSVNGMMKVQQNGAKQKVALN
jgi:hypothetical protein